MEQLQFTDYSSNGLSFLYPVGWSLVDDSIYPKMRYLRFNIGHYGSALIQAYHSGQHVSLQQYTEDLRLNHPIASGQIFPESVKQYELNVFDEPYTVIQEFFRYSSSMEGYLVRHYCRKPGVDCAAFIVIQGDAGRNSIFRRSMIAILHSLKSNFYRFRKVAGGQRYIN